MPGKELVPACIRKLFLDAVHQFAPESLPLKVRVNDEPPDVAGRRSSAGAHGVNDFGSDSCCQDSMGSEIRKHAFHRLGKRRNRGVVKNGGFAPVAAGLELQNLTRFAGLAVEITGSIASSLSLSMNEGGWHVLALFSRRFAPSSLLKESKRGSTSLVDMRLHLRIAAISEP